MFSREKTLLKWRQPTTGLLREVRELYRNRSADEFLSLITKGIGVFLLAGLLFVFAAQLVVEAESFLAGQMIGLPSVRILGVMIVGFGFVFFLCTILVRYLLSWYGSLVRFRETFLVCNGTQYSYDEITEYELSPDAASGHHGSNWQLTLETVDGNSEEVIVPPLVALDQLQSVLRSCLEGVCSTEAEVEVYRTSPLVGSLLLLPTLTMIWPLIVSIQQQSLGLADVAVGLIGPGLASATYVYLIRPRWVLEENQIRITDRLFREDRLIPYSEVTKVSWNRDVDMHQRGKLFPYPLRNLEKSSTLARKIARQAARNGEVEIEGNQKLEESLSGKD